MSSWTAIFPTGIKPHDAERGDLRYTVPIRFVPKLDAEDDGKRATHTKDCNHWKRDGTWQDGSDQKKANVHSKEEKMQFAQFMKNTEKTLKKLGKKVNNKRKRSKRSDSESSSDSE